MKCAQGFGRAAAGLRHSRAPPKGLRPSPTFNHTRCALRSRIRSSFTFAQGSVQAASSVTLEIDGDMRIANRFESLGNFIGKPILEEPGEFARAHFNPGKIARGSGTWGRLGSILQFGLGT